MLAKHPQAITTVITTATALTLLVMTATAATVPARSALAFAPPVQETAAQKAPQTDDDSQDDSQSGMQMATKSHLIDIELPSGARRALSSRDVSKLRASAASGAASAQDEKAAHVKDIKDDKDDLSAVSSFEILRWSGETAETARAELSKRLKSKGYTVTEGASILSEEGRVTTLEAKLTGEKPGNKASQLGGVWVESKTEGTTLVWSCVDAKADTKAGPTTSKAASK